MTFLKPCLACAVAFLLVGCAEIFPAPRPDATGVVRVGCSAYEPYRQLDACDQRAATACDGPALMLDASYAPIAPPPNSPSYQVQQVDVSARYQCTAR